MSQWPAIADIAAKVQKGELKALALVEQALKTITATSDYDAILESITERSKARAAEIDKRIENGEQIGRLAGVPFVAKDNFLTFGSETTAASNILKGFKAPYQATAIERLEAEGAIVVAKANLDAFGHGASTENSDFVVTKNPHDKSRVPGGSSGGSAASVVLDIAPFAIGTDTGGSNRQPGSLSGCVGYKPTYGLVSRSGVIAMASSTDTIGALTRTVEDLGLVLDVMAGLDPLDSTTVNKAEDYTDLQIDMSGKKLGVIKEYMGTGLDAGVKRQIEQATVALQKTGMEVKEVSLPSLSLALACYYIICPAEISSNLSRYDGQRYGFTDAETTNLDESYQKTRTRGFGREAKRRIMIGTYVLSSGYYDAYYKKAQQLRTKLIQEFSTAFETFDFLLGPTAPTPAFKIGENTSNPLQMYLADIMTVAASLAGIPAISVPAGFSESLPVGLQLMAPMQKDRDLLAMAKITERVIQ